MYWIIFSFFFFFRMTFVSFTCKNLFDNYSHISDILMKATTSRTVGFPLVDFVAFILRTTIFGAQGVSSTSSSNCGVPHCSFETLILKTRVGFHHPLLRSGIGISIRQCHITAQENATIYQVTTMLATSKKSYFQVITTC